MKKESPKSKSEDQLGLIQNVENVFDFRENTVDFFRDYSFLLSEVKFKAKCGMGFKILTTKQML